MGRRKTRFRTRHDTLIYNNIIYILQRSESDKMKEKQLKLKNVALFRQSQNSEQSYGREEKTRRSTLVEGSRKTTMIIYCPSRTFPLLDCI